MFADHVADTINIDPCDVVSDYVLVTCLLLLRQDLSSLAERLMHGCQRVDRQKLCCEIHASPLCSPPTPDMDVYQLFTTYDTVLLDIAD